MHWSLELSQIHSSYLVLFSLALLVLAAGTLYGLGVVDRVLRLFALLVRAAIEKGFVVWERLFSWASWPLFLGMVLGLLAFGAWFGQFWPGLKTLCGLIPLGMGMTACFAYMLIDLERYEVQRGYKAVHKPMMGQGLATHLARYGHQVGVPLLFAATVAMLGGFALLNQGLYETFGANWYKPGDRNRDLIFADFLAYVLINLLGVVDVLDLAQVHQYLRVPHVSTTYWPASTLLSAFKAFFTLVLLQQIFASVRQGKLLTETIADFWSPHESIHLRARNALPQFGTVAIRALLGSLRAVASLTKEQREQLPTIVTTIGPSAIPTLLRHLHDRHEHVRVVVVAGLGHLHALEAVPLLVPLAHDPSEIVRQALAETLGLLGGAGQAPSRKKRRPRRCCRLPAPPQPLGWLAVWKRPQQQPVVRHDPVELAVATLTTTLGDEALGVRLQSVKALGSIGAPAAHAAPRLIGLLVDADETIRCEAANALSKVGGDEAASITALTALLQDPSTAVKAAGASALGAFKQAAAPAAIELVALLQDREETVRSAAAEALARIGPLDGIATETLVEGLASRDNVVRAQTAEALGTIGAAAEEAAPALVAAMKDNNDFVRAKAVEALGKIGEGAAEAAVPSFVRALRDQDNWVSALAAEALGQMGESADGAIPALVYSLRHLNPQVRANAAEALGRLGAAAAITRLALEQATRDEDGGVRSQATRALGAIGTPTTTSREVILTGLEDGDPLVRAAAVECLGQWQETSETILARLLPLLEDANDQVKLETAKVLPRLSGPKPEVIEALCRRLLADDNPLVQVHTALALGTLGAAASAAGPALLHAIQTSEVSVREQAMRAIARIQPPETLAAFTAGLKDASGDVRKVASGGWMNAAAIPEEVVPLLVAALRDPELQVRANAANALSRLDTLPPSAVPMLLECATDPSDGLRLNVAFALKRADFQQTHEALEHLVDDANLRIRLLAAGTLLAADAPHARAGTVLREALSESTFRFRKAALELLETLGSSGELFVDDLKKRSAEEEDPELRTLVAALLKRWEQPPAQETATVVEAATSF